MKKLAILALSTIIVGCATSNTNYYFPKFESVYQPPLNATATANVGETMISKSYVRVYPAIKLDREYTEEIKQNPLNNRWSGTVVIPPGVLIKTAVDANGSYYESDNAKFVYFRGTTTCKCGVYVPTGQPANAVVFMHNDGSIGDRGYDLGTKTVDYLPTTKEVFSKDSFKAELLYNGAAKKVVKLSYREFKDDVARPAFTQELTYDLAEGDVIGFKGARFKVLKTSNSGITYKVLSNLE